MYRKNTNGQYMGFQLNYATNGAGASNAAVTVNRCADGAGAYTNSNGAVTFLGGGGFIYALTQGDTNGNDVTIQFSSVGCVTVEKTFITTACDPTNGVNFGMTALPGTAVGTNASLLTNGTGSSQLNVVGGNLGAGAIATNTLVAGSITAAAFAAGAINAAAVASGTIVAGTFAANAITNAAMAATCLSSVIIETGVDLPQAISMIAAACAGKASGVDTGSPVYNAIGVNGTNTARIMATATNGNRTAVALTLPAI